MVDVMKEMSILVTMTAKGTIGDTIGQGSCAGSHLPSILNHFRHLTTRSLYPFPTKRNALIIGYRTWQQLYRKRQWPLRLSIVVRSRNWEEEEEEMDDIIFVKSFEEGYTKLVGMEEIDRIFVIGGRSIYEQALLHPQTTNIIVSLLHQNIVYKGDVMFPSESADLFDVLQSHKSDKHTDWTLVHFLRKKSVD